MQDGRVRQLRPAVEIGTYAPVDQSVLRQAQRPLQAGLPGKCHRRTVVGIKKRIRGIGFCAVQAADMQQRIGSPDPHDLIQSPRLCPDEDPRPRQGVVESAAFGSGQRGIVGMQSVKRIGRFGVGPGLAEPLAADEEQRLLFPQHHEAQQRRQHHHRHHDHRRQYVPAQICARGFHGPHRFTPYVTPSLHR